MTASVIIKLTQFSAIQMIGPDSKTYLNSQVTAAVSQLEANQACFAAHCDAKGKSWSHFYLLPTHDSLQLFQRTSTIEKSLAELNKYGVFSKTDMTDGRDESQWFAILGDSASPLHTITTHEDTSVVKIAEKITLVHVPKNAVLPASFNNLTPGDESQFEHALIAHGISFMHAEQQGEFVPQMLNLHALDGISFNKGCYMGQETIARMRYLGKNKRAAYIFSGSSDTDLTVNDTLEIKLENNNWRRSGQVVNAVKHQDTWYGLAVFPADIDENAQLRLKTDEASSLNLSPLPYSLEYKETK